jgi:hypothetical protein
MNRHRWLLLALLLSCASWGCTTAQTSNTARTATEQLLISNAVDYSLDKVDFRPFAGQNVYFEEKYVDCVDKNYVIASIRHRLLSAGASLVAKPETADVIVEARSGGVGTTTSESFIGVPEIVLPGTVTLPEVRLVNRSRQEGIAKIGITAYDAKSGQALGPGGQTMARMDDNNWYVAGVGPWKSGLLKSEVARSTTGRAAWTRERIPAFVTFNTPSSGMLEPAPIQFTGGSEPQPAPPGKSQPAPVPQAKPEGAAPADSGAPAWAR